MGRNMAQTPSNRDIRGLPVSIGLLVGAAVSFGAIFTSFVWFQSWVDDRVSVGVRSYSNELIFPRIDRVERSQARLMDMLETQDQSRNRQYGETKKLLEELLKK